MFKLTVDPIIAQSSEHHKAGGFVSFEGKVRNHSDGREVLALEYEAYPELAITEGEVLIAEAKQRFGLLETNVTHRTGRLNLGETAVLIQVSAPHRREAFAGCEWIIDQLKVRVPIWKRETYADGDSGWVGAESSADDRQIDGAFFARQVALAEVGKEGQAKLLAARVLMVGVGGLGSACLPYLVGAGVGTIVLCDADEVDISNLHRQVIYRFEDAGRSKVERAAAFAKRLWPGAVVGTIPYPLDETNVDLLVKDFDWIVDGTDSLDVKFLLNAACRRAGKPLVTASVHKFEGQIMTITPDGPCLNCLFPEPPPNACVGTCAETGILGVVPGLLGVMQANEVLKGILGYGPILSDKLLLVELRTGETTTLRREKRDGCQGCTGILEAMDWVEIANLAEAHEKLGEFTLIDIRELDETPEYPVPHVKRPLSSFTPDGLEGKVVLGCQHGIRSYHLAVALREMGHKDVFSLRGGIEAMELSGHFAS